MNDPTRTPIDVAREDQIDRTREVVRQTAAIATKRAIGGLDSGIARTKGYARRAERSDPRDSNVAMNTADKNFVTDRRKPAPEPPRADEAGTPHGDDMTEEMARGRDMPSDARRSTPMVTAARLDDRGAAGPSKRWPVGPIGSAVGAALAGPPEVDRFVESTDPTIGTAYWRSVYDNDPGIDTRYSFDDYVPAFSMGFAGRDAHRGLTWEQAELRLAAAWEQSRGASRLSWQQARAAARSAWRRAEHAGGWSRLARDAGRARTPE
jgi:hypothetical protein